MTPKPPISPLPLKRMTGEQLVSTRTLGYIALGLMVLAGGIFVSELQTVAYVSKPSQTAQAVRVVTPSAFDGISLEATSSIVMDLTEGRVLFERAADAQLPLASLTKVPLAYVVAESMPKDAIITIPRETAPNGKAAQLAKGSHWHLNDLLTYTLVASSNDGAEILAEAARADVYAHYPQSPENTATLWRMNNLTHELHLSHTYFLNPTGLDESTTQAGAYGSARDMAHLFAYVASTSPDVYAGTTRGALHLLSLEGQTAAVTNTDEAIDAIPGLVMGKTGYTDLAGGNLVVVFDISGHRMVAVVMHSTREGRFADMKKIVAAARETIAGGVAKGI